MIQGSCGLENGEPFHNHCHLEVNEFDDVHITGTRSRS